jgi:hypothetical protein
MTTRRIPIGVTSASSPEPIRRKPRPIKTRICRALAFSAPA